MKQNSIAWMQTMIVEWKIVCVMLFSVCDIQKTKKKTGANLTISPQRQLKDKMMSIEDFASPENQMSLLGRNSWSVPRLFELSKDFEVMEIPLVHLNVFYTYDKLTLRDMVMHMKAVKNVDLSYPIILDEDGELMDGRHRIMKAMLKGKKTIKAVRFDRNPSPCTSSDD